MSVLPWHIEQQINEVKCRHAAGLINWRERDRLIEGIEAAYVADLLGAQDRNKSHASKRNYKPNGRHILELRSVAWRLEPSYFGEVYLPNTCSNVGEILRKGRILYRHQRHSPIARSIDVCQDERGLTIFAEALKTTFARDACTVIRERQERGKSCRASIHLDPERTRFHFENIGGQSVVLIDRFAVGPRDEPEVSFVQRPANRGSLFL
jgi:hypothetical protein